MLFYLSLQSMSKNMLGKITATIIIIWNYCFAQFYFQSFRSLVDLLTHEIVSPRTVDLRKSSKNNLITNFSHTFCSNSILPTSVSKKNKKAVLEIKFFLFFNLTLQFYAIEWWWLFSSPNIFNYERNVCNWSNCLKLGVAFPEKLDTITKCRTMPILAYNSKALDSLFDLQKTTLKIIQFAGEKPSKIFALESHYSLCCDSR